MRNLFKFLGVIALALIIGFSMTGCDGLFGSNDSDDSDAGSPDGDGTGGGTGNPRDNAKTVTVGYSASHTIASSGEHWFKFTGTGDPVIFETRGNVVDTYIDVYEGDSNSSWWDTDDNSGEGSNALFTKTANSGTTYFIKVTARSSTSGTYTFVVE